MKEYEFIGKTVESAVEEGLKTLNLKEEEAEYTVLEEGKKGLFKSVPAKVRMWKKMTDGERAVDFLDGLFDILKITATTELIEDEESTKVNVITTGSYSVIGHCGEMLDALQILVGAVANIGREEYKRVVVDCEGYREKREFTLKKLAHRLAEKSVRLGRKVAIEPMSAYERRIIHAALSDSGEVETISEGTEPNRYVIIIPKNLKPGADRPIHSERRNERSGNGFNRNERRPVKKERKYGERWENRDSGRDRNRDRRDNRGPRRNGERSGNRPSPAAAKKTPFFGTYLGNSGSASEKNDKE